MKVLFIIRSSARYNKGGDLVQANNTADALRLIDVDVDICYSDEKIDYSPYDLLHFFNILRPADILAHVRRSKKQFVVSTIYLDLSEYEKKIRKGIISFISKVLPGDTTEYLKVIARALINNEKINSISYLFLGQKKSVKLVAKKAACLLPNSFNEYKRFQKKYGLNCKYKVVPNGIDDNILKNELQSTLKEPDLIICVGRIEPYKNQLNVIKALNNTNFRLVIIGAHSANATSYYEECKNKAAANVFLAGRVSQDELVNYYKKAKVHVLASWFETTGLSSLEAASQRCNVVITDKGDTKEYFEGYGFYCEPHSEKSILNAVEKAAASDFDERLHTKIYQQYTWMHAAEKTLEAYKEVLQA
jgi:glycosyltransferase involved in cell wall biosynthesis